MAAPPSKTIKDLNGKWQMNKSLSGNFESVLSLQGVGFLTRKAIASATVTLTVTQVQAPPAPVGGVDPPAKADKVTHIIIDQTLTGGIKGTTEKRCVDSQWREHSDWLFGHVSGRTFWVPGPGAAAAVLEKLGAAGDAFLGQDWPADGEDLLVSDVKNLDASGGWVATQVWGFQTVTVNGVAERRYVRNVVVTKGDKRVAIKLVYDYVGEREGGDDVDLDY